MLRNCTNCGGRIEASADGRNVACVYCGSSATTAVDPRALAAGITADAKSLENGFDRLLVTFEETFPGHTTVRREGLVFKKVTGFDVTLDELTFRLTRENGHLVAKQIATVRGITLKTETLPLDAWLHSLAEKLSSMASGSAAARDAFTRIAR